jgi:hypothetical protein
VEHATTPILAIAAALQTLATMNQVIAARASRIFLTGSSETRVLRHLAGGTARSLDHIAVSRSGAHRS